MKRRELRVLLADWQVHFPTLYPVKLKLSRKLDVGTWGSTEVSTIKGQKHLVITLDNDLGPEATFMVFVHEYAHAMAWRPEHQEQAEEFDHSPQWGICEARLWHLIQGV